MLFFVLIFVSCSSNQDPEQELTTYCIRECVVETSDSEICDTNCKCAASSLSGDLSKQEFMNLVENLNDTDRNDQDSSSKLKKAFKICANTGG